MFKKLVMKITTKIAKWHLKEMHNRDLIPFSMDAVFIAAHALSLFDISTAIDGCDISYCDTKKELTIKGKEKK